MDKLLLALGAVVVVIGLVVFANWVDSPSPEQLQRIQRNLPEGCEFKDLGEYGKVDAVYMVYCPGRETVTLNQYDRHGKTSSNYLGIQIKG